MTTRISNSLSGLSNGIIDAASTSAEDVAKLPLYPIKDLIRDAILTAGDELCKEFTAGSMAKFAGSLATRQVSNVLGECLQVQYFLYILKSIFRGIVRLVE